MTAANTIFDFETDFAGTLRCIPMAVRLKLDRCGIKLSLKQWSRFGRDDRAQLLDRECDSEAAVAAYRDYLAALIETRAKQAVEYVDAGAAPEWGDVRSVPPRIVAWAAGVGVQPPTAQQWAGLSDLQRFALFKLTRPGHDNDNFVPALREFGLLEDSSATA
jgi:hypothetical protein